ncbi:hypothetical protein G6L37_06250 [Agrobacterium rubi]|nr:hypothetical protein [Agrobacterium rubi]NTF24963.1 hypothetical protein [Agrobacterium rubi]
MNRSTAIRQAFEAITWQDLNEFPFEPGAGDIDRLIQSACSSSETIVLHSLARIHAWVWPLLKDTIQRDVTASGGVAFEIVRDDEDTRLVSIRNGEEKWILGWTGMSRGDPTLGLGLYEPSFDSGQKKMAYCRLPSGAETLRGRLMAVGDDVTRIFGLFSMLQASMPTEHVAVLDGSRRDDRLQDARVDDLLVLDGGIGGSAADELHRMAEQHAAKVVFDWMPGHLVAIDDFLKAQNLVMGSEALRFNDGDRIVCGIPVEDIGRRVVYSSVYPHDRNGDRYLTWADGTQASKPSSICSFAVPADMPLAHAVEMLRAGDMKPTAAHDYDLGTSVLESGGMQHVCGLAQAMEQILHMTICYREEHEYAGHERIAADDAFAQIAGFKSGM